MNKILFCLILALSSVNASAQYRMEARQPDFYNLPVKQEPKFTEEAKTLVEESYKVHPEYALKPYNSPCENCTELVDRRKEDERYFVENGTGGKTFYVQRSYGPMHLKDNAGNWISIDPRLTSTAPGIFTAADQHFPVKIDVVNHFASLTTPGHEFRFNTNLELMHKDILGTVTLLGEANWSNYTAGADGIKVFDAWPGIDMEMQALQGKLKTNFIVKERLPLADGWLMIKDKLDYEADLQPDFILATQTGDSLYEGTISFRDNQGHEYYTIDRAFVRDAAIDAAPFYLSYRLSEKKELSVFVPIDWLNDHNRVYPVVIDPLVSSTADLPQLSIIGSQYGPQVPCGNEVCWSNGCPYSLTVPVPANTTITNVLFSFNYNAISGCYMNEGGIDLTLSACRSPNVPQAIWYCTPNPPQGGACNGNNLSILSHISSCIPAPQCPSYDLTFGMNFYRRNPAGGTACSNSCIAASSPWIVTVQGNTVELTATSTQTICVGNSATITVNGNNGVGPYSYIWSPGDLTGTSITVSPLTTTVYTATGTDGCNQTATVTSTVTVTQNTNPGFTITPNPVCAGQPVALAGLGAGPSSSYDWLLPNSTTPTVPNNKIPTVTYNTAGTFNITLNYQQGACTFPNVQQITVTPGGGSPSVTIAASPSGGICGGTSVTFTPTPTNGGDSPSYQWEVNGDTVSTSETFVSNGLNEGDTVQVLLTSNAQCASPATVSSGNYIVSCTVGVKEINENRVIDIFPNPSNGIVTAKGKIDAPVEIKDVLGRPVFLLPAQIRKVSDEVIEFDLGNLPPGIYVFSFKAGTQTITKSVVKN